MNKTPIEWTDFSVNPFRFRNKETGKVGHHCTKISPGCKNCFSSAMQAGPYLSGLTFLEENKSKGEFFLDENVLQQVLKRRKPCRIFWADMSDLFLEDYPDEWIDQCFAVMALTPHLTHQVLTKRADRMQRYSLMLNEDHGGQAKRRLNKLMDFHPGLSAGRTYLRFVESWPLPNVHWGVSVEDQQRADERIPHLLQTPAAVRFLSIEPLLGPVDLSRINYTWQLRETLVGFARWSAEKDGNDPEAAAIHAAASVMDEGLPDDEKPALDVLNARWFDGWDSGTDGKKVDWVIVGGESGPEARPMDISWARSIVEQCQAARVPVFVKQLGAKPMYPPETILHPPRSRIFKLTDKKGAQVSEWPKDLQVREYPEARAYQRRAESEIWVR